MGNQNDKGRIITVAEVEDNENREQITSHDRSVEELLDSFHSSEQNASVMVYRVGPNGGNDLSYLETFPADRFDFPGLNDYLRNKYRGGLFRLHFRISGRRGIFENRLLDIEPLANVPATSQGVESSGAIDRLASMIQENNRVIMEMLQRKPDVMAEMRQQAEMMKLMREAFGGAPVSAAPTTRPEKSVVEQINELAATVQALRGMGGLFGGGENVAEVHWTERLLEKHGDSLFAMGSALLNSFTDAKRTEVAGRVVAAAAARPQTQAPRPKPTSQGQRLIPKGMPDQLAKLLNQITDFAEEDQDVEIVAEELLRDPQTKNFLLNFANAENPFKQLCKIWPSALDFPEWFLDLIDAIRERLTAAPAPGQDARNVPTGDGNDAAAGNSAIPGNQDS